MFSEIVYLKIRTYPGWMEKTMIHAIGSESEIVWNSSLYGSFPPSSFREIVTDFREAQHIFFTSILETRYQGFR